MKNYNFGVVSISFRDKTILEILKAASEAGLKFIEWGSDVHAPCEDKARLLEIAQLQEKYNISASSYGTYFRLGKNDISELEDYIAAAKILKTQCAVF